MSSAAPVVIVGGGLVGLSGALFLSSHGVPCLLVERHPDLLIHPRARGVNPRTIELYRQLGLEPAILAERNIAWDPAEMQLLRAETLASEDYALVEPHAGEDLADASPCAFCPIDQDRLEILLRREAERLGADIRFATELVSFEQDGDGVTARLCDLRTGTEQWVRGPYLIAADGWDSGIRSELDIGVDGPGPMFHTLSLLVEADLSAALRGREVGVAYLSRPRPGTVLLPNDGRRRWTFGTPYFPEDGERVTDYSEVRCADLLRAAAGLPDVDVEILPQIPGTDLKVLPFVIGAQVARRFRADRVFLAGDAAHSVPPTGGFGASVGIQDAHNLAWKLAMVMRGEAGAELLGSYEAERLPVARFTMEQAMARAHDRMGAGLSGEPAPLAPYAAVVFGYQYRSTAVLGAPADGAPALHPKDLAGAPGSRAPHVPITLAGTGGSTLDLYGRNFVLLCGGDGGDWTAAAGCLRAEEASAPVRTDAYRIGVDLGNDSGRAAAAHGIGPGGAVLVRPDGFVAWRSEAMAADPAAALGEALDQILARR